MSNGTKSQSKKLFTRASNRNPIQADMDLSAGVHEVKCAPGQGWNGVELIVHPLEVCDLGIKECCPGWVTHSGGPECDALDFRSCREMELHKQRVEFREGATERMADLQPEESKANRYSVHQTGMIDIL